LLVGIFDRRPAKRYNIFEVEKVGSKGMLSAFSDSSTSLPLQNTMTGLGRQLD
jgi:hypothetical protein